MGNFATRTDAEITQKTTLQGSIHATLSCFVARDELVSLSINSVWTTLSRVAGSHPGMMAWSHGMTRYSRTGFYFISCFLPNLPVDSLCHALCRRRVWKIPYHKKTKKQKVFLNLLCDAVSWYICIKWVPGVEKRQFGVQAQMSCFFRPQSITLLWWDLELVPLCWAVFLQHYFVTVRAHLSLFFSTWCFLTAGALCDKEGRLTLHGKKERGRCCANAGDAVLNLA